MSTKKSNLCYIIAIFCIFFLLTACTTGSNNTKIEEDIIVVENEPGGGSTHFNIFDKSLNLKNSKKASYSVMGTRIQSIATDEDNVYITTQYENSPIGEKMSDDLLVYSLDAFKESSIRLMSHMADSIVVDDTSIYTTFNWDEGVLICKQDKEGKNHIKRNLDPSHQGLIENMVDMGEKIGLVYTNMNERTTYLHVVSKDTLKTTETLKLESDKFSTYRYIMYRGGYIYLAGSTEDENYRGVLTIVDLANKSSKNIYTQKKEEFVSIHDKGDKLILFACDSVRYENSGSSVYEFDKKTTHIAQKSRYDLPIERVVQTDDQYFTSGYGNICRINKNYKIDKQIKAKSTYTSQIFVR